LSSDLESSTREQTGEHKYKTLDFCIHADLLKIQRQRSDLLIHFHEVKFVPRFGDLSVFHPNDDHAGKFDRLIRWSDSDTGASVRSRNAATDGDPVTLDDRIFDLNFQIRISRDECSWKVLKFSGPTIVSGPRPWPTPSSANISSIAARSDYSKPLRTIGS
jgi:hypothetical protein